MKYSLRSSFARWVLGLFFAVLAVTIMGRTVALTGAIAYCDGFPFCVPSHPLGWLKLAHILFVGIASLTMLVVLRKAWREQRKQRVLLPLTTILGVMFFGQALVGAMQVTQAYPPHLVFLHKLTTLALWVSLLLLVYTSGKLAEDFTEIAQLDWRQRTKDFFALSKPLIVGLLLITTYGGLVMGLHAWPSFSLTMWTLLGGALAAGGSSALNQYIDRELDKNMQRTAKRPLADGRLTDAEGLAEQVAPQLIPAGVLVTVPLPVPVLLTVKAMGAGPKETTKATAEPEVTDAPAAGFWLITLPAGTTLSFACVIVPTVRLAFVTACWAAACVNPTTFGTVTTGGTPRRLRKTEMVLFVPSP